MILNLPAVRQIPSTRFVRICNPTTNQNYLRWPEIPDKVLSLQEEIWMPLLRGAVVSSLSHQDTVSSSPEEDNKKYFYLSLLHSENLAHNHGAFTLYQCKTRALSSGDSVMPHILFYSIYNIFNINVAIIKKIMHCTTILTHCTHNRCMKQINLEPPNTNFEIVKQSR